MQRKPYQKPTWLRSVTEMSPNSSVGWLVKDIIPEEGLVIAFGDSGAGELLYIPPSDASVWSNCERTSSLRCCVGGFHTLPHPDVLSHSS